jgi:hypothetical protein
MDFFLIELESEEHGGAETPGLWPDVRASLESYTITEGGTLSFVRYEVGVFP